LQYNAIPAAVNESNFGKTIISKYKGVLLRFENFLKILHSSPKFVCSA
jgi:hypothetical protein